MPLLGVLVDSGGSSKASDALDELGRRMEPQFKPADLEPLASSGTLRWRNAGQWARLELVRRGLMEPSERKGIWEISDAGRRFIEEQRNVGR